jgi:hypothetical protein
MEDQMKTAVEYAKRVPDAPTMEEFTRRISDLMRADGVPHAPAEKVDGVCLTCGKSVLCPGVHTLEEILEANRLQMAAALGKIGGTTRVTA